MREEGFLLIAGGVFITVILYIFLGALPSIPFFILTLFLINFFRDPHRTPETQDENDIISPADGKVLLKQKVEIDENMGLGIPELLGRKMKRIAIFMSPFDVHVNRAPISGVVVSMKRYDGGFARAFLEKSEKNSRVVWHIKDERGQDFILVQIAGAIARRISTFRKPGDKIKRGERIGMIYFGSRVDLYIPEHFDFIVREGDKVFAGKTCIAQLKDQGDLP